jgi:transposase
MRRHEISDERWVKIKDSLPGKAGVPGRAAEDNRLFIEAVCWIARTGLHGAPSAMGLPKAATAAKWDSCSIFPGLQPRSRRCLPVPMV